MNPAFLSGQPLPLRQTHYRQTFNSSQNYRLQDSGATEKSSASEQFRERIDAVVYSDGTADASGEQQREWTRQVNTSCPATGTSSYLQSSGNSRSGFGVY